MFDVGFLELLLVGVIALIILGPERLPKAAQTLGLWIGKAKQSFETIKTEIDREVKLKELQQEIAQQKAQLTDGLDVTEEINQIKQDVNQTVNSMAQQTRSIGQIYEPEAEISQPPVKKAVANTNKKAKTSKKNTSVKKTKTETKAKPKAKAKPKTKAKPKAKSKKTKAEKSS